MTTDTLKTAWLLGLLSVLLVMGGGAPAGLYMGLAIAVLMKFLVDASAQGGELEFVRLVPLPIRVNSRVR